MSKPKLLSETPITMAELKKDISRIRKRDTELGFRSQKTEEYLNTFCHLSDSKASEMLDELRKLEIPRAQDDMLVKLVDILPLTIDELKVVLQGYTVAVSKEQHQKIMDVIKKYV